MLSRPTKAGNDHDVFVAFALVCTLCLAASLSACGVAPVARHYTAYTGTVGSVSGQGERTARLTLKDGGVAAVQLSSPGRPSEFFAEGTWRRTDDGFVIELPGAADRLAFRRSGNLIIAKEWDPARWGNEAPVLYLVY
jgi:hypothetical protein